MPHIRDGDSCRELLTENLDMMDPNILQWSPLLINKHIIQLIQHLHPLHHPPKHRMLSIQVLDILCQSEEELTAASPAGSDSHGQGAFRGVFEGFGNLGWEVARGGGEGGGSSEGGEGLAACAQGGGVAGLGDEVFTNCEATKYCNSR